MVKGKEGLRMGRLRTQRCPPGVGGTISAEGPIWGYSQWPCAREGEPAQALAAWLGGKSRHGAGR